MSDVGEKSFEEMSPVNKTTPTAIKLSLRHKCVASKLEMSYFGRKLSISENYVQSKHYSLFEQLYSNNQRATEHSIFFETI